MSDVEISIPRIESHHAHKDLHPQSKDPEVLGFCKRHRLEGVGVLLVLTYLFLGSIVFYQLQEKSKKDVAGSINWAVVTFLTIGYGDELPTGQGAKVFTIFYIIGGVAVQAAVGGTILGSLANMVKKEDFDEEPDKDASTGDYLRLWPHVFAIAKASLVLSLLVIFGALMLHYTEGVGVLDSFYFGVVTLTTVGYGDITPARHKVIFCMYYVVGVLTFSFLLGQSISIFFEIAKIRRLKRFFEEGVTHRLLRRMDKWEDGKVDRCEFIIFMGVELKLLTHDDVKRINGMFVTLDANGDGVLDLRDMERRSTHSQQNCRNESRDMRMDSCQSIAHTCAAVDGESQHNPHVQHQEPAALALTSPRAD